MKQSIIQESLLAAGAPDISDSAGSASSSFACSPPPLVLHVEVLSPATARADRRVKRPLYLREGVDEYWMVDADAAIVERWCLGDEWPEVLTEQIAWHPGGATEPLTIEISDIIEE